MFAELAHPPEDTSADVSDTVALCREGNVSAWKRLYDAHFDFAYRTAHRLGAPHGEVEDVVHEAFEIAFQKLAQFSHGLFTTGRERSRAPGACAGGRTRRWR